MGAALSADRWRPRRAGESYRGSRVGTSGSAARGDANDAAPARRRQLIRDLEEKIAKLGADLSALLSAKFQEQLARYEQQLLEVIQPYERFLETERAKLERAHEELAGARREVDALEQRIATTFSGSAR